MTSDVRELLPLYALGLLEVAEAELVELAVARDPGLAGKLAALLAATDALITPVTPAPDVHARLVASIGGGRFEPHASRMASLFDVTVERARELLGLIERTASWELPMPGLGLVHFDGGPAYVAADCGFVRLAPGTAFPHHAHLGEEVSLILAGTLRDHTGRLYGPGEELVQSEGSEHEVTCDGDDECVYAARAMNGISIAGAPARPPRKS